MTDPFTDVADELMTRSTDMGGIEAPPPPVTGAKTKKHVCPYCGAVTSVIEKPTGPCPRCNMEDTPATRAATKARIGPWFVLQTRNPSAPGMKWATLLSLVSKGQVTPRSVVRGPTTHQLWKFAAHVKGLSREFNLCYSCGGEIERTSNQCPHCDRLQEPPVNPDALLESRELGPRLPVQREIKQPTDLVVAQPQNDELAKRRNPDDGILSAKELAAAFQLDFNPDAPVVVNPPAPRARRSPKRALAALILLAAIGCGAVLFARPDYREKSLAWISSTYGSIKNSISPGKPANPMPWDNTPAPKPTEDPAPAPVVQVPTPAPAPAPAPTPAPAPERVAEQTAPAAKEPIPAAAEDPPAPEPKPIVAPAPPPKPAEQSVVNPMLAQSRQQEKLQAELEAPIPTDRAAQERLAIRLWNAGMDSERQNDIPLAIKCYQKLKLINSSARGQSDTMIDNAITIAKQNLPN